MKSQQIARIVIFPTLWLAWVGCMYAWGTALAGQDGASFAVGFDAVDAAEAD